VTRVNLKLDAGSVDAGASSVINTNSGQSNTSNLIGRWNGLCARAVCRAPNARWWNHLSHMYYCEQCAQMLNASPVNAREAQRRFNGPLCVLVDNDQHDMVRDRK
jgi:hypothetical protein